MTVLRIVSVIDIDSSDAFSPCANDPDPDPCWPSKRRQHGDAFARCVTDTGVRRLCYSCAHPKPPKPLTVTLPDGRTVPADPSDPTRPLWLGDGGWYD